MSYANKMGDRRSSRINGEQDPDPATGITPTNDTNAANDIDANNELVVPSETSMPSTANESYNLESDSYNERIELAQADLTNELELNQSHSVSSESMVEQVQHPNNTSVSQYLRS